MSWYGCIMTSMKIFSQNHKFILYTDMCPIKYLSNCCPIYLCADVFFLKKVKFYSTFLLKWLLLMVLNFKYSFKNFHSNQICGISEHCSILCPMTQMLQFWFGGIPTKNTSGYTTDKYVLFENTQRNKAHTFCNSFLQCIFGIIKIAM